MHILMLNYEYPPLGGGGGVATQTLVEALSRKGVQVTVVTSGQEKKTTHERPNSLLTIIRLPVTGRTARPVASLSSLFSYIWQTRRWAKSLTNPNFSVVHSQFAVPTGIAGKSLAKRWKIPHVVTVHGFDVHDPTRKISADRFPPVHFAVQRVLHSAQAITTQSQDIATRTRQGYTLKAELSIIPLGIPAIPVAARQQPKHWPDGFVVVGVGRLVERKGFNFAISALTQLPQDVHLVIIGDGPQKAALQAQAEKLSVADRFHLVGAVFDLEKWNMLAHAQVYILPSLHEGFSLSTVEAMMMGLPVVSTNVGGQTDYLKPGVNALLVAPADPNALAQAILKLSNDQKLCAEMRQQNFTTSAQFTDQKMAEHYLTLYARLLH